MHHKGQVLTADGKVIGHFEFDDRTGQCLTRVWATEELLIDHWRQGHLATCTCGKPPVEVVLYEFNYVPGSHWPGKVCFRCDAIVDGIDTMALDPKEGHPFGLVEDDGLVPELYDCLGG